MNFDPVFGRSQFSHATKKFLTVRNESAKKAKASQIIGTCSGFYVFGDEITVLSPWKTDYQPDMIGNC